MMQPPIYALRAQDSIHIDAQATSIWAVLSDFYNVDKWAERAQYVERIGNVKRGMGSQRRVNVSGVGIIEETITVWQENQSIGYSVTPIGPIDTSLSLWEIEINGDTCRVSLCLKYNMKFGVVGRILHTLIVRKKINERVPVILSALKCYVETGKIQAG